ncbi:MAG: hypothetical protein IJ165_03090, partial [Proteobacteria bacterium]|nr:hypothetical protein [Pseudomonadota bacterium]
FFCAKRKGFPHTPFLKKGDILAVFWGGCVLGWLCFGVAVFWGGCVLGWLCFGVAVFWDYILLVYL